MARVRLGRLPSTEGELARLALAQEGIEVELTGEQLSTLQGAIPASEVLVELWVDSAELERAQRVLATTFKENTRDGADVSCPSCSKSNPPNFDVCWSCGADLSRAERVASAPPSEAPKQRPPVFTVLFAVAAVLLGFLLWQEKQLAKYAESPNVHFRWTSESCLVREVNGRMASRSCDYDHNGVFELTEEFDTKGRLAAILRDDDQNELPERIESFDTNGKLVRRDYDTDGDRRFERGEVFDVNERLVLRELDDDGDGRMDRTEGFDAGTAP